MNSISNLQNGLTFHLKDNFIFSFERGIGARNTSQFLN